MSSNDVQVFSQEDSKCPRNTPFKQQLLPSVQPTLSPSFIIPAFFVVGIVFIAIGAAIIAESDAIQSYEFRYDNLQKCPWDDRKFRSGFGCEPINVTFRVTKAMKAPIYIYYKVSNFNQNNRRFVRSVSNTQLGGRTDPSASEQSDCKPFYVPSDFITANFTQPNLANFSDYLDRGVYFPCGLVPWSMFNDTLALYRNSELLCDGSAFDILGNPTNIENIGKCEKRGIGWDNIAGVRYKAIPEPPNNDYYFSAQGDLRACTAVFNKDVTLTDQLSDDRWDWLYYLCNGWYFGEPGHVIPDPMDEDLWVWNRISSQSTFKKLYRKITVDLPEGDYYFLIIQRWDISSFDGQKSIVLETVGWIGSKNYFLGSIFVITGCLACVIATAFLAKHWAQPPRLSS